MRSNGSLADDGYVSFAHRHMSYVDQGRYAPMLARWFDAFGRDRVLVEISEEMYADPQASLDRVTDRLRPPPARRCGTRSPTTRSPTRASTPRCGLGSPTLLKPDIAAVEDLLGRPLPWGT